MAVQLVLRRPVQTPSMQVRVIWQGFREGDRAQATWSDASGAAHRGPSAAARWIQRDGLRQGEEWKVNLPGVPAGIDRITLQLVTSQSRTVGVAVQPLSGNADDAVLHPGAELTANRPHDLVEFTRSGSSWLVTALNSAVGDRTEPPLPDTRTAEGSTADVLQTAAPTPSPGPDGPIPGWAGPVTDRPINRNPAPHRAAPPRPPVEVPSPPRTSAVPAPEQARTPAASDDFGPQVQIPTRLEPAVDAARATGNTRQQSVVGAVVDISASMRPWMVSGQLADVLTAVQAVAGASNRPAVATRFHPAGVEMNLELAAEPAQLLTELLGQQGLRTGNRSDLAESFDRSAQRDGLHVLVTDDPSMVAAGQAVVVVLGRGDDRTASGSARRNVVLVPPGPVDVRRLARELANATASH